MERCRSKTSLRAMPTTPCPSQPRRMKAPRRPAERRESRLTLLQQLPRDDDLLNLARPFVDPQRAYFAVETLHRSSDGHAESTEELHGAVDHTLRCLRRMKLRNGAFQSHAPILHVFRPRGAIHEQRGSIDVDRHVG